MTNPHPADPAAPAWYSHLEALLAGAAQDGGAGAQLTVTDPDGTVVYRQPLARHARLEDDGIWFRQIVGDGPEFDINACRRRSLPITDAHPDGKAIKFPIPEGTATIAPADPDQHNALRAWDAFIRTELTEHQQAELALLSEDSWWG